jgi:hypothetical protein
MRLWNKGHGRNYLFSQAMLLVASLLLVFFISIGWAWAANGQVPLQRPLRRSRSGSPPGVYLRVLSDRAGGAWKSPKLCWTAWRVSPRWPGSIRQIYAHVRPYLRGLLGGRN